MTRRKRLDIDDVRRVRLFFVSYAPLWGMLAFRALPGNLRPNPHGTIPWVALAFGALTVGSIWSAVSLIRDTRRTGTTEQRFRNLRDEGESAGSYLVTYLLPLFGAAPSDVGDWLAYGLYFAVAAVIYVRSELTLVNPTLYVLGWRVVSASYEVTTRDGTVTRRTTVLAENEQSLEGPVSVARVAGSFVVVPSGGDVR